MILTIRHDLELLRQTLLHGKLPRSLSWADTLELLGHLGAVQSHGDNEVLFVVGTERAFFKKPHTPELGVEEVSRLRAFLRKAEPELPAEAPSQPRRMVVVIDHHAAHVYQDFEAHLPDKGKTLQPYDPFKFHHHLIHRVEAHYKGQHVPEETSFFEEVAENLVSADQIVLIGHGTGKSSAAGFLVEYLQTHHPIISAHVIATETADLSALTNPELEVMARARMMVVI